MLVENGSGESMDSVMLLSISFRLLSSDLYFNVCLDSPHPTQLPQKKANTFWNKNHIKGNICFENLL